jgi:hypothetical protein
MCDLLDLTALNYNACLIGESERVTVGLSGAAGEVLAANPTVARLSPQSAHYI